MRHNNRWLSLLLLVLTAAHSPCQTAAAPQTARQALLEMFFGKNPGSLQKHLPEALLAALHKSGANTSMLDGVSLWTSQMKAQGQELQTFETGSTLLVIEDQRQGNKFEITVEHDDLQADRDDIELAFRGYKNGQVQSSGFAPRFVFSMKPESGIWRLTDITVTVQVSLTDPELLKTLATPRPKMVASVQTSSGDDSSWSSPHAEETQSIASMKVLVAAEKVYAQRYSAVGYTCSLSDLGGMGGAGEANQRQARLIDPRLASGKKGGYTFTLSGCAGTPASSFRAIAAPASPGGMTRVYCADDSGVIRSSDGSAASCLNSGTPVQ